MSPTSTETYLVDDTLVIRPQRVDPLERAKTVLVGPSRRKTDRRWMRTVGWIVLSIDLVLLVAAILLLF